MRFPRRCFFGQNFDQLVILMTKVCEILDGAVENGLDGAVLPPRRCFMAALRRPEVGVLPASRKKWGAIANHPLCTFSYFPYILYFVNFTISAAIGYGADALSVAWG